MNNPPTQAASETSGQVSSNPATGGQIARGAAWMMGFKLFDRSIGLVSTLMLARILTPGDFGLVAMATAVVAILELMGAFGFDSALIQRQNTQREHYDTAWTFNVIFGVTIAIFLLILAIPAAGFYHEPRLKYILPVLAISAFTSGFENIGTVAFRKELDFKSEFRFLAFKRVTAFIVTVTLAFTLRTYWALIAGVVTGKLVSVFISYRLHPYRPRLSLAAKKDLLHFSKWIFFSNLINVLQGRSVDFILGRTVGSHGLGIYNIGSEIAVMPSTELIAPLNRAVFPAYSRLAGNTSQLWLRFQDVYGTICLIVFPVTSGLLCIAPLIVQVLLGQQWLEAIPIMQIIAVCGLAGALQSNLYLVIVALGKPKSNTMLSACLLVVSLPTTIYASLQYGALGAAYAHLVISLFGLVGIIFVFSQVTGIRARFLGLAMWRPLLASGIMSAIVYSADAWTVTAWPHLPPPIKVIGLISLGAISYVLSVFLIWVLLGRPQGAELTLISGFQAKFKMWKHQRFPTTS